LAAYEDGYLAFLQRSGQILVQPLDEAGLPDGEAIPYFATAPTSVNVRVASNDSAAFLAYVIGGQLYADRFSFDTLSFSDKAVAIPTSDQTTGINIAATNASVTVVEVRSDASTKSLKLYGVALSTELALLTQPKLITHIEWVSILRTAYLPFAAPAVEGGAWPLVYFNATSGESATPHHLSGLNSSGAKVFTGEPIDGFTVSHWVDVSAGPERITVW